MKKLMVALAAVACGAVFADGIESSNICGYQNIEIVEGFSMLTPTFENIDGSKIDLTQLSLTGDGLGKCKGTVGVQLISSSGQWIGEYYYWNSTNSSHPSIGWYDADDELLEEGVAILEPGEALFFDNEESDDIYLLSSGGVAFGCANALPEGFMQVGNNSPVDIDLQDFVPAGDGLGKCKGTIGLQTINSVGQWDGEYYYWGSTNSSHPTIGWYDADDEFVEIGSVPLTAGKGTFVDNEEGEDIYMSVPNPVADK